MTNRDYVNSWSNEKLAIAMTALGGAPHVICGEMEECDISLDCTQCCLKWLEKERSTESEGKE